MHFKNPHQKTGGGGGLLGTLLVQVTSVPLEQPGPPKSSSEEQDKVPKVQQSHLCPPRGKKHCPEEYTRFISEDLIRNPRGWGNQKNFSFASKSRVFKAHPWTMHDLPYFPLLCQQPDTFLLQPQKCWNRNQNIFILLNHLHQSPSDLSN